MVDNDISVISGIKDNILDVLVNCSINSGHLHPTIFEAHNMVLCLHLTKNFHQK